MEEEEVFNASNSNYSDVLLKMPGHPYIPNKNKGDSS